MIKTKSRIICLAQNQGHLTNYQFLMKRTEQTIRGQSINKTTAKQSCEVKIPGGGHLYLKLDIIRVKGLSKHTLNTYFSGMKIDPKYAFLHAFFII